MEQMTFHVPNDVLEHIDSAAEERDISKSQVARELLEQGIEYEQLENKNEELRNKLEAANSSSEVDDKLVKYVEHDIDWHEAGIATKLRWFVFGRN